MITAMNKLRTALTKELHDSALSVRHFRLYLKIENLRRNSTVQNAESCNFRDQGAAIERWLLL